MIAADKAIREAVNGSRKTIDNNTGRLPTLTKTPGENSTASSSAIMAIANRTIALIMEFLSGTFEPKEVNHAITNQAQASRTKNASHDFVSVLFFNI